MLAVELLPPSNVRGDQQKRVISGIVCSPKVVCTSGDPIFLIARLHGSAPYWNHGFDATARSHRDFSTAANAFVTRSRRSSVDPPMQVSTQERISLSIREAEVWFSAAFTAAI